MHGAGAAVGVGVVRDGGYFGGPGHRFIAAAFVESRGVAGQDHDAAEKVAAIFRRKFRLRGDDQIARVRAVVRAFKTINDGPAHERHAPLVCIDLGIGFHLLHRHIHGQLHDVAGFPMAVQGGVAVDDFRDDQLAIYFYMKGPRYRAMIGLVKVVGRSRPFAPAGNAKIESEIAGTYIQCYSNRELI